MIKPVSTLSIIVAGVMCIVPTFGAQMTPQIQRLLDQKQEKIKKLEECEGKKQGWMIAGISTIGVTAVGVGLNIAQASKRNRLDDEIDTARHDLEKKQEDLSRIQNQIAEKEREKAAAEKEKAERERAEQVAREQAEREKSGVDGVIGKECNDGKGLWFTALKGNDKKCSDSTGAIVDCKCIEMTNFTPGSGLGSGVKNNPAEKPKASEKGGSEKTEESKYTLPSYNPYGESGECKGEYGDRVTKGCTCKSDKGLISRFNGPKGDNFCECPNGKTWDAGQDKCVDIKKAEKKTEESKYTLPSYNPYGESGDCKGEYGDRVTKGCTCKSAKGLVSRFNGPKGDNFCECQNGKTWDAGQDKCVDIKKTEKKEEETPKYQLPSYNPYGESGECKGEYGDRVTKGCTCKSDKGLISRFNGPKCDNFCECPNGKTWDAGQDKCVDIKKTEKKEEETPKYQLPSYSFDYALPVTSGNCAGITQCNNVKTFIPKTEEELKCLKQNCDNIGGKWRQEHKLTYVCGC